MKGSELDWGCEKRRIRLAENLYWTGGNLRACGIVSGRVAAVAGSSLLMIAAFLFCAATFGGPQPQSDSAAANAVTIDVQADRDAGTLRPIWNFWGYDEPNYTYAANGKKLLREFAALSPEPVYIRVHNLLTTGDGAASLKWGSTNVYTEDASGKAIYSWEIVDRIFDTFRETGVRPLVQIGFMPEALSTHPQPYRHEFPKGPIFTGWVYPPKDYGKWAELVFQFAGHLRERYGDAAVKTWLWEVWNEPDIDYWKGTPEEYFRLYDVSVDAVLRAVPDARIGGPDSTGPGSAKSVAFLQAFLEHCARGKNYSNGKIGTRLDFVSFHPKGAPTWKGDHVEMGIAHELVAVEQGFKIVRSFAEWKDTPVILGESDPEGCAACSAKDKPENGYRNGTVYASYTAEVLSNIYTLAAREQVHFLGAVNWSFEFEDQPYFAGYREMATNGIDKPVLNAFRMFGLLGERRVVAKSSGALTAEEVVSGGVRGRADVGTIATRKANEVDVVMWNYHDEDLAAGAAPIELEVEGLPASASRVLTEHFRLDATHSNAFEAWKRMGSPQEPTASQYRELEAAGQLQMLSSPAWTTTERGAIVERFELPRHAMSLVRVTW
jgi:xylan 1,4-beta-xylosidase